MSSWPWLVAGPLFLLAWIFVHESAHALAILASGGEITVFDVFPGGEDSFSLGHVTRSALTATDDLGVALAPTVFWLALQAMIAALAMFPDNVNPIRGTFGRIAVIFGFLVPTLDVSLSAAGLFSGADSTDWYRAFHGLEVVISIAFAIYLAVVYDGAVALIRKVWGPQSVSGGEILLMFVPFVFLPWLRYAF